MKYLLHLAYKGTNYHGWQRQKNTPATIQEILESKVSMLIQQNIALFGCGRTDKGVHASQYFAHFSADTITENLVYKLNRVLPKDIVVYEVFKVPEDFNSRFDATKRTYRYYFHLQKDVFNQELSTLVYLDHFDLPSMAQAIKLIPNYEDFGAFCKAPDKLNNTLCKIFSTSLYGTEDQQRFCFEISANRFLRGMIRIIMQRLLLVLNQQLTVEGFEDYLKVSRSPSAIEFAYPQGLFLHDIAYANVTPRAMNELNQFLFAGMQKIV